MKNTNKEFAEALRLMDQARDLQDKATFATLQCLNYIESHTDKPIRNYGTDLMYNRTLLEAIENYINDDEYVVEHSRTLKYDIKDAMEVKDYEYHN
jgi:hypothetical protein